MLRADILHPPRRSQARKSPTFRIVVPLGPAASCELAEAAATHGLTIRTIVLRALALSGIPVPRKHLIQARRAGASGRKRVKATGYALSVILPPTTFHALQALVVESKTTLCHLVRVALQNSGFTLTDVELVPDRRKRGVRTLRRHYAETPRRDRQR